MSDYICVKCGLPITGGKMYGAGDGTGQKFMDPECYWRERAEHAERQVVRLVDERDAARANHLKAMRERDEAILAHKVTTDYLGRTQNDLSEATCSCGHAVNLHTDKGCGACICESTFSARLSPRACTTHGWMIPCPYCPAPASPARSEGTTASCDCCGHPLHNDRETCGHPEPTWHEGMCHCAGGRPRPASAPSRGTDHDTQSNRSTNPQNEE